MRRQLWLEKWIVLSALLTASCASPDYDKAMAPPLHHYERGDFAIAANQIAKINGKDYKAPEVFRLEHAMAVLAMGNSQRAESLLQEAVTEIGHTRDENEGNAGTGGFAAAVLEDTQAYLKDDYSRKYVGADFEIALGRW